MAERSPLEGLMAITVDHQTTTRLEPQTQPCQPSHQAPKPGQRQSSRSCRDPRRWVRSGSGSRSGPAGSGCGSIVIQPRALRTQHSPGNAARERSRVRNLRQAFHSLQVALTSGSLHIKLDHWIYTGREYHNQAALPAVPPDTKLSKLDVLVLATNYIAHLMETLDQGDGLAEHPLPTRPGGYLHPVKKWPMRSLLYCGSVGELLSGVPTNKPPVLGEDGTRPLTPSPQK